jgi:hypothetical protein
MDSIQTGTVGGFRRDGRGWARILVRFNQDDEPAFVEYYEPIGFTSSVPAGQKAEAVVHSSSGNWDNAFCTLINFRGSSRPGTPNGETAIYWFSDPSHFIRIGENAEYNAGRHIFSSENGYQFRKGREELIALFVEIIESLASSSKAGETPVTNAELPQFIERLKQFAAD